MRLGMDVDRAVVATWDDGSAIESFLVTSALEPDPEILVETIVAELDGGPDTSPVVDAELVFDDVASPWHTVCQVSASDTVGLLHSLTTVFAAASLDIDSASIGRSGNRAVDRFELTGRTGSRLDEDERALVRSLMAHGVVARRRRLRGGFRLAQAVGGGTDAV
jgi:UTP:GlnB (protein PII) uridylyltransferase